MATAERPATIERRYHGKGRGLEWIYQKDKAYMESLGYEVDSHMMIQGGRSAGAVLFGVLLLGLPFLFMKPDDILLVRYRKT